MCQENIGNIMHNFKLIWMKFEKKCIGAQLQIVRIKLACDSRAVQDYVCYGLCLLWAVLLWTISIWQHLVVFDILPTLSFMSKTSNDFTKSLPIPKISILQIGFDC